MKTGITSMLKLIELGSVKPKNNRDNTNVVISINAGFSIFLIYHD